MALTIPEGCSFLNKTLILNGVSVPFIHYKDGSKEEIWMPAKPVMKTTGETTMTQILNRVFPEDKMTFEDLVKSKGLPLEGCCGFTTPPNPSDHNEKIAIWVNDSGFYSMVLGSRKPHCVAFQRWVMQEVLPSIRCTGQYTVGQNSPGSQNMVDMQMPQMQQMQQIMQLMMQQTVQQTVQQTLAAAVERMTPVQINVNKTPRSNEDLRRINLPAPVTTEEGEALGERTLFVTDFLRSYLPHVIPGIDEAGGLLQQLVTAVRGKFGESLQSAKLERGPLFRCGQLGRSQPHYEVDDDGLMREVASRMHGFFLSNFERIGHANQYHGAVFPQLLDQATKRRRVSFEVEERQPVLPGQHPPSNIGRRIEVEERQPVLLGQYPPSNIGCRIDLHRELIRRKLPDCLHGALLKTMVYLARRLFPFYEPKTKLIIHPWAAPTRTEFTWYFYKHHEAVLERALMDVCGRYSMVFINLDPISCAAAAGKASVMEPCYCVACSKSRLKDKKAIPSSEFVESKERTETTGHIMRRWPKGPVQQ